MFRQVDPKVISWIGLISVSTILMMINIDYTSVNLALMAISKEFRAPLSNIQWVISGYTLVWASFVIIGGKLGDLFGKKKIFLIGLGLFIISSLSAAMAQGSGWLIFSRVLQGIASGLFYPSAMALAFTAFSDEKQGLALGILSSLSAFGLALGPTIGGIIISFLGWRGIFFINLPIGLLVAFFVAISIDEKKIGKVSSFDLYGAFTLFFTLVFLILSINEIQASINLRKFIVVLGMFFFFAAAFIRIELSRENPLIEFSIFKNTEFVGANLIRMSLQYSFASLIFLIIFFMKIVHHYTDIEAGMVLLAMTFIFGALSPFGGKMFDRFGAKIPIVTGMLLFSAALYSFSLLDEASSLEKLIAILFFSGLGLGLAYPCVNTSALKAVEKKDSGLASGIFTMNTLIGVTLGVVISNNILIHALHHQGNNVGLAVPSFQFLQTTSWIKSFIVGFSVALKVCAVLSFFAALIALKGFKNYLPKAGSESNMKGG